MTGFLLVSAISVGTTLAAFALARAGRGALSRSVLAPGLAAGVMLWLALVEVAPDSAATMGWLATLAAMAGGAALVWLTSLLAHRTTVAAGVAPVIGVALVLHDLPEGFAVGALLTSTGLVAALPVVIAVAAHNLPEKLAFVGPADGGRLRTRTVVLAATLPEPLGAALAGVGAAAAPGTASFALAIAGGMMLAVAVGALPTVARRARSWRPFLGAGAAGAMSMAALAVVLPG
jgi:hypothetical protein